jgi:hypothetical protein
MHDVPALSIMHSVCHVHAQCWEFTRCRGPLKQGTHQAGAQLGVFVYVT